MLAISSPGVIKMLVNRFFELRGPHYSCSLESRGAAVMERELDEAAPLGRGPWPVFAHSTIRHGQRCTSGNAGPRRLKAARRPTLRSAGEGSAPSQGLANGAENSRSPRAWPWHRPAAPVPFFGYDTPRKESLGRGV